MATPDGRNPSLTSLGWALYLACSWTWCIGMFLPTLMVRDYGVWGFVVFAAPNVIGAAGMGWVLATREAAERIAQRHAAACNAFSAVTIAFHLFFIQWLGTMITGLWWIAALVAIPVFAAGLIRRTPATFRALAASVWLLSLGALAAVIADRARAGDWILGGADAPPDLLWLAPVCVFGFALCPYLDVTFLRARRECSRAQARVAFTLGFGVFFLVMILLTLLYARLFPGDGFSLAFASAITLALLVGHVAVQSIFTCAAHWRESLELGHGLRVGGPLLGVLVGLPLLHGWSVAGLGSHEVVYRCFMAFYGLVFPSYVWLCMIPTRDGHAGLGGERGRSKLLVWAGAVGVAMPFYWFGFVRLEEFYLVGGLLVVLLARLVVRSSDERPLPAAD